MTTPAMDDLDAVRTIIDTLSKFDETDQARILRWALEKLGMSLPTPAVSPSATHQDDGDTSSPGPGMGASRRPADIKSFVAEKNPSSDNQFAAVVAYFYRFEAPEQSKKTSISGNDLQEAARQAGRKRLARPGQTLINAHQQGYFDKAADGYSLNTVGENLVAMALPEGGAKVSLPAPRRRAKATSKKKPAAKKK